MKLLHILAVAAACTLLFAGAALAAAMPQLPNLEQLVTSEPIAAPDVAPTGAGPCVFFIVEDAERCRLALASSSTCPPEIPRRLLTLPLELFASGGWLATCRAFSGAAPPG